MVFGKDFESFKVHESNFEFSGWYLESNLINLMVMKVALKPFGIVFDIDFEQF